MPRSVSFLLAVAFALPLRAEPQLPVKSYGQELVDRVVSTNPGLLVMVLHVSPPGASNYPIIASNIGRIGKVADEDDMRVVTTGKANLEVAHNGKRFEVELPMRTVAGESIGALGLVFAYKQGDSKSALERRATRIRDALARRVVDAASLVESYPLNPLSTTRTHAQRLIDETFARHRELDLLAIQATPAKGRDTVVLASTFGRIGRATGDETTQVIATGQPRTRLHPSGKHVEVELPLLDLAGATVGSLSVGWPARPGKNEAALVADAEAVRDALRRRIPSLATLVELDP